MVVAPGLDQHKTPATAAEEQTGEQKKERQSPQTPWENTSDDDHDHAGPSDAGPSPLQTPLLPAHVPAALKPGHPSEALVDPQDTDDNVWAEATRRPPEEKGKSKLQQVPDVLQPGGGRSSTNPFLKRKPVPQSSGALLTDTFSKLDINDAASTTNPWQQGMESKNGSEGHATPPTQPVMSEAIESDPWATNDKTPLTQPSPSANSPLSISLNPGDDVPSAWKEEGPRTEENHATEPPCPSMSDELLKEQNVWDDLGAIDKGKGKVSAISAAAGQAASPIDDWNLIDADASSKSTHVGHADTDLNRDMMPPLPSRRTGLRQKWVPSRQPVDAKAETYQIKNVRWHDPGSEKNPRISPILIQNENGPCPLVALVNALTMTTPPDSPETTLVEILRPREQISLDLLLNAVFDELMSPRRTNSDQALPDVAELYAFLQSLHTGMNVNPRFVPTREMVNAYKRTSLTHLHPTERGSLIPGTFENTMEMGLYAAFSIPLIHGWLPAQGDPVYSAMERRAASYEDAQKLLFCEEELTSKLSGDEGLTEDEQQLFQDIMTIKTFLESSATQLTAWGIEVIGKAMRPGSFAILFRNDHFSTLYCHAQTLRLLSLVTDAGYHKHDGVVWETLVDVNGEHTDYLSGDCRVIGSSDGIGPSHGASSTADRGRDGPTTHNNRGENRRDDVEAAAPSPLEQEDRDLALALQLQEEEDQRHREEQSRRRRESVLSEQFIEQQGRRPLPVNRDGRRTWQGTGIAPERRGSATLLPIAVATSGNRHSRQSSTWQPQPQPRPNPQEQIVRPLVPPRRPRVSRNAESNGDDAPPSYEQAAQDPAYAPPPGQANHSQSSTGTSTHDTGAGGAGASSGQSAASVHNQRPSMNQPPRTPGGSRGRDCVLM